MSSTKHKCDGHMHICICGDQYDIKLIYGGYYSDLCESCVKISNNLINRWNINDDLIHSKYNIIITYEIIEVDHEEECSDPKNITKYKYEKKISYPLLKIFNNDDLIENSNFINLKNMKLKYYRKNNIQHGECYLYTIYDIIEAEIVATPSLIDLNIS